MRLALFFAIVLNMAQLAQARGLDVLRGKWGQRLATASMALMLAMPPSNMLAQQKDGWGEKFDKETPPAEDHWRKVFAGSPTEFRSVVNLLIDTPKHRFSEHLIYLGQDRDDGAMFLTMTYFQVTHLLTQKKLDHNTLYKLRTWDGSELENVAVDLVSFFPVDALDFYDIALVRIAGLELHDFTPVHLAHFPPPSTPINQLSYLERNSFPIHKTNDFNVDPNDDNAVVALGGDLQPQGEAKANQPPLVDLSLYWQRCQSGTFDSETGLGAHTCAPLPDTAIQGSVIFNSLTGNAIGFYLIKAVLDHTHVVARKGKVLSFSPEILTQVDAMLSISPHDKLSVSWGALKNER